LRCYKEEGAEWRDKERKAVIERGEFSKRIIHRELSLKERWVKNESKG